MTHRLKAAISILGPRERGANLAAGTLIDPTARWSEKESYADVIRPDLLEPVEPDPTPAADAPPTEE